MGAAETGDPLSCGVTQVKAARAEIRMSLLKFSFVQILTRKCEVGFIPPINFKMLHTNQAELNQLYDTYCRVWAAGGQATLTTTSLGGKVTAKLDVELGQPTDARPGAPPPHLRTAKAFSSQHGAPASGAARRPCHRGPAAKAKSRARAAAHLVRFPNPLATGSGLGLQYP